MADVNGSREGRHDLTRHVWRGSNWQDENFADRT